MSNNTPDYKNDLIFPPQNGINYASCRDIFELQDKIVALQAELDMVLQVLVKASSKHRDWVKANFPDFKG